KKQIHPIHKSIDTLDNNSHPQHEPFPYVSNVGYFRTLRQLVSSLPTTF
ncbi:hypothetical protein KSS87_014570, partial [Heliosperma pusillum]